MFSDEKILVIGACGQLGSELTTALREIYGRENVIASDIQDPPEGVTDEGPFEKLDILDTGSLVQVIHKRKITHVYQLAAILSALGERTPRLARKLNMDGLINILDIAKEGLIKKIFWPSSIAVFGPNTPKINTPQHTVTDPNTVYGITKLAGEQWCAYYHAKYNVDIRSLRYPGLISYKTVPGGGTTDYAVDIFRHAVEKGIYSCFLKKDTTLPMMYMPDAVRATLELTAADSDKIKIRSSYNLAAMSFSPEQVAEEIKKYIPKFSIDYQPDERQKIADAWPKSIDDSEAKKDWGWKHKFEIGDMTADMLKNLQKKNLKS